MTAVKTIFLLLLLAPSLLAGPIILVANKKGSAFEAELLSATEITATVRRSSDKKLFTLKLETLSADCVKTIEKHRPNLKPPHPEYESEVSIGTRKRNTASYSRITQDVTATAKITNASREIPSPETKGRIVFIGQNQKRKDTYEVLATRDFTVAPEPGQTLTLELRPFVNSYYKDNSYSSASYAGYKYDGYFVLLFDDDNQIVHHYTTNSRFKKVIEGDIGILDYMRTVKAETELGKSLRPMVNGKEVGSDVISVGD